MKKLWLVALGISVALTACGPSRSGKMFTFDQVKQFKVGTTTKADVRAQMGEPQSVLPAKAGVEAWLYQYPESEMTGTFTKTLQHIQKTATLAFSGEKLADLEWSDYKSASEGSMLRSEAGAAFDMNAMEKLRKGKVTPGDVEAQFGPAQKHVYRYDGTEIWVYVHVKDKTTRTAVLTFKGGKLADVRTDTK